MKTQQHYSEGTLYRCPGSGSLICQRRKLREAIKSFGKTVMEELKLDKLLKRLVSKI